MTSKKTEGPPTAGPPASSTRDAMMIFNRFPAAAGALLAIVVALNFSMPTAVYGQSAPATDPTNAGKAVFSRANCVGCHKWHGNGGGGYGGDALSLRKTELTREQIIETVSCGRPGTAMPDVNVSEEDANDMVAYLYRLR